MGSGDHTVITETLGAIARSRGTADIAERTRFSGESLYRALSADGNPTLATMRSVLKALQLRLSVSNEAA